MVIQWTHETSSSVHVDLMDILKTHNSRFEDITLNEIEELKKWVSKNTLELYGNPYYASELYDCDIYDHYEMNICEFLEDGLHEIRYGK